MRTPHSMAVVAGALALTMVPAIATAQDTANTTTDSTYSTTTDRDENDFPWGLLGLLGLAGLLGRKKHDTVHVDNTRPRN